MYKLSPWKTHVSGKRNTDKENSSTVAGKGSRKGWMDAETWHESG